MDSNSIDASAHYPVEVIRCSPNVLNNEEFGRYSTITQVDTYPRESDDFSESWNDKLSGKDGMSFYIKKLNAGMNSRFFSSVCFPSSSRESLLGRISQGRVYSQTETKKVPVIRFKEGVFKSLKIVKPIPSPMLKTDIQIRTKPTKTNTGKTAGNIYFRNKLRSDLLLDNYTKHRSSMSIIDHKQQHLAAHYFSTAIKTNPKVSEPIKLVRAAKLYDKQNYDNFMNQWKTYAM